VPKDKLQPDLAAETELLALKLRPTKQQTEEEDVQKTVGGSVHAASGNGDLLAQKEEVLS